ncbi:MAG: macro domain-containing protein, partial [Chloroflexota bacterium]|nr:macro domain-containing protein [Chloroflexota bacterium]
HGPVTHAKPAYTTAGKLPCRYVIHAVGPIWGSGDEDAKLTAAVAGALHQAEELGLHSLALPAISTGIYGFPQKQAANVIFTAIREYAAQNPDTMLELVRLVLYGNSAAKIFLTVWDRD